MIGTTISHYKIIEKIGEGGMAVVYKGEDTKLKRTVALKFISPVKLEKEDTKTRFIQEAQTAAGLNHPNITTVYEIEEADDQTFIVMEYIEGTNLRDIISSNPLTLSQSLDFALQIAEGLQEAHNRGIIHRDIKSSNIMITPRGQVKIMDFGLVKLKGATQITKTSMVMGTVSYMSPEQAASDEVDTRTDIWSIGVILYEMLTGRLPFRGANDQIILHSIMQKKQEPLSTFRSGIPFLLTDIVDKCLKKNPKERYQTVTDLKADLEHLKKEITTDHVTLSLPMRLIPRLYRKPIVRIAVPLSAAVLV
jgi:serine/threonine protein kinase